MKPAKEGYRVAVVGASSLLGKELVSVLEQGKFPLSRLLTFESDEEEPELPIIDLNPTLATTVEDGQISEQELDFAFLCARLQKLPAFLDAWQQGSAANCLVIDVVGEGLRAGTRRSFGRHVEGADESGGHSISGPSIIRLPGVRSAAGRVHTSAHPAVIVISSLLLRLGARFPLKTAVAHVFTLGVGVRFPGRGGTPEADREYSELPEDSRQDFRGPACFQSTLTPGNVCLERHGRPRSASAASIAQLFGRAGSSSGPPADPGSGFSFGGRFHVR